MKNYFFALLTLGCFAQISAQTTIIPQQDTRVITTGVPFLLIASDARAAGMGDMGVATSPDAFSQKWNSSKNVFATAKSGISLSYTPYLSKLVNDIGIGYLSYYNRLNEQSAFGASLTYFSLGEIEIITQQQADIGNFTPLIERPNELAIDASYALRLSDQFSMSVTGRFLRSDLKLQSQPDTEANAASTFAVDIAGYYQSEEIAYDNFNGRWRAGFAIQNTVNTKIFSILDLLPSNSWHPHSPFCFIFLLNFQY